MAKLARENRLRERRMNKKAKKDARKQAASEPTDTGEELLLEGEPSDLTSEEQPSAPGESDEAVGSPQQDDLDATDPRAKEVALHRLRDAPDEELAVFEAKLRESALETGASEREIREAQRDHPGHAA
ncbi:MAG TPA: hypothetical protein VHU13_01235 [Solirubrobacteraceae bacterium]|nr:hypothetical protein [Solirubrobacteraceae bacterium]